ncbi:MAG TPA: flagellar basal body P-ring formation chaperone FlgA [Steroidobacteraceae bacterium]|nr:flagellar basal body P-ring formation chaperone FlgA [Steroidobacteraceae bacterium]
MSVNPLTLSRGLVLLLLGLTAQANSQPAAPQSLPAVRLAAESALRRELDPAVTGVTFKAAELDPRLRVAACTSALVVSGKLPRGTQARVLVRVACNSNAYWTLNVPVEIHRKTDVLVMRRAVGRGELIRADDVLVQSRVLPGLTSPYISRTADLASRLTRRPIPEGTALTADALDAALLIHRGQNVVLTARAGGFEVRAPGVAMADAAAEQRVRVRNLNSLKIVEGVADTAGVVRVNP